MDIIPNIFTDVTNGKLVRACVFRHNANIGETVLDDHVVTYPADFKELLSEIVESETGLWPLNEFNQRFAVKKIP